jgi:hypothetical protein
MDQVDLRIIKENLVCARRFLEEVLGGKNQNAFDELVADDIRVSTVLKPGGLIEGKGEYVRVLGETVSGQFSDRELTILDVAPLLDGRVMARVRAIATHTGEVFGTPATGRCITMHELCLMRFRDGKLVEVFVGSLNFLEFEMLFAQAISAAVLGPAS